MQHVPGWQAWRRWVVANVLGEIVGFSLASVGGAATAEVIGSLSGIVQVIAAIVAVILIGTAEGAPVGLAQWSVLRAHLPTLSRSSWALATVVGAVVAWGAGIAIATVGSQLDLDAAIGAPTILLGVMIGLITGTILAFGQWWVLRRLVYRAAWWLPANALGWAAGMIVAFVGVGAIPADASFAVVGLIGALTGLAMGAVVAAITGTALIWLLRRQETAVGKPSVTNPDGDR